MFWQPQQRLSATRFWSLAETYRRNTVKDKEVMQVLPDAGYALLIQMATGGFFIVLLGGSLEERT